jgi:hypothetical protein
LAEPETETTGAFPRLAARPGAWSVADLAADAATSPTAPSRRAVDRAERAQTDHERMEHQPVVHQSVGHERVDPYDPPARGDDADGPATLAEGQGAPVGGDRAESWPPAAEPGQASVDGAAGSGTEGGTGREASPRRDDRPGRRPVPALLQVVSGLAVAGAATMRWSTLATSDERRTFTGLVVGDGRITLVLGLGLALLGLARLGRRRLTAGDTLLGPLLAGVVVVLAAADVLGGPPTLATFQGVSADKIVVRPEVGLYLSLVAGAVALLAALTLARVAPARGAGSSPGRPEGAVADQARGGGHRADQPR